MKTKSRAGKARTNNGPSKRVGSGRLVVLGLSAAKVLCRQWREIAQQRHIDEKEAMVRGMPVTAGVLLGTAQGLETAIRDIQRRMERAKKRQPQHNEKTQTGGATNLPKGIQ